MGEGKQVAIPAWGSKRRRVDAPSSSNSAALEGLHGSPEDVTSDKHSVLKESPPPPPQASTPLIEAQGEPPTGGVKWNFNLGESADVALTLPPVPAGWLILESLPSEEQRPTLPEAVLMAMMRCLEQHRIWLAERERA